MLSVRNQAARGLLVAMILCLTVIISQEFLQALGLNSGFPINFSGEFAFAPLLYLFVCSLSRDEPAPLWTRWPYFVPLGVSLLWTAVLYYVVSDRWMSLGNPATRDLIVATVPVKITFFLGVMYFALTRPLALSGKPAVARQKMLWIRSLLWVAALSGVIAAVSFVGLTVWPDRMIDSDTISAIMTIAAIYGLGYFTLFNRDILNSRHSGRGQAHVEPEALRLHDQARAYLEHSRASEDPQFALSNLAAALGTGEGRLAKCLSACTEGGFNGLLNDARLATFHRLLDEPINRSRTILELAYEAGFNSKATFYRHFRAREGMAPKVFIAQLREAECAPD
jgi:AraC-like DNA-binding protein